MWLVVGNHTTLAYQLSEVSGDVCSKSRQRACVCVRRTA